MSRANENTNSLFRKIEREAAEPKISQRDIEDAKQTASKLQKMIEINVSPDLHNAEYDEYLNELVQRQSKNQSPYHLHRPAYQSNRDYMCVSTDSKSSTRHQTANRFNFEPEDEFKCKSLVHLEETECLDQYVTTTTTVRTRTKDDLFMLFDNQFFGNENHSEDQLNEFFKNAAYERSKSRPSDNSQAKPKLININKNVYSCLNNYFSNSSGKEFTTV